MIDEPKGEDFDGDIHAVFKDEDLLKCPHCGERYMVSGAVLAKGAEVVAVDLGREIGHRADCPRLALDEKGKAEGRDRSGGKRT